MNAEIIDHLNNGTGEALVILPTSVEITALRDLIRGECDIIRCNMHLMMTENASIILHTEHSLTLSSIKGSVFSKVFISEIVHTSNDITEEIKCRMKP